MGTSCDLKWRVGADGERLWVVAPGHPIVEGVGEFIQLEAEEMYGEHFDVPPPEQLVFVSWFDGGEVFRSGCCYTRGTGKIFYFRPGHESFPTFHNPRFAASSATPRSGRPLRAVPAAHSAALNQRDPRQADPLWPTG
jgi:trehalose utilization protein